MIDVFVSRPSWVPPGFRDGLERFLRRIEDLGLTGRTLGQSDYPTESPLDGVIRLMEECRGAVILGYPQVTVVEGRVRDKKITDPLVFPTEWNHIEAGLAYAREVPLLLIHHRGVCRGIFDRGATDRFLYAIDLADPGWPLDEQITGALRSWRDDVLATDQREEERLRQLEKERLSEKSAELIVKLTRDSSWAGRGTKYRIVVRNEGSSDARNIDIRFPDGNDPIPDNERNRKLPIGMLPAGTDYQITGAPSMGNAPPYRAVITWVDDAGEKEAEFRLT